jgi:2-keto-3-deoxy-L-rhamnonate aldolase RhmA
VGTWILLSRAPAVVRMAATAGLDFVFIDMEHSGLSSETVTDMCEVARACSLPTIVRPHECTSHTVSLLMDLGASGVMIPDCTSRAAVDGALAGLRYPPDGRRGHTSGSTSLDYEVGDEAAKRAANERATLVVQIESRAGIDAVESVVAAGGVDLLEVGAGDLSTSLGVPSETRHPEVLAAIDHVVGVASSHGIAVGVNASSVEDAQRLRDRGVRCVSLSNDRAILLRAYREAAGLLRSDQ